MTAEQMNEMKTRFQAWRKLDPGMNNVIWFVGTSVDATGTVWTQGGRPERVIGGRVRALANAAVEMLRLNGTRMDDKDWSGLFSSPLDDFDFRIHLKSSVLKQHSDAGSKSRREKNGMEYKNIQLSQSLDVELIGHDSMGLYVED